MTDESRGYGRMRLGGFWLLLVNLVLLAGQVGLGKQAALEQRGAALHMFVLNPFYYASMACLLLQTVVWPMVLTRVPLGFAYGVNSLNYVTMLAVSRWVFGESITRSNLIGASLIMAGVCVWAGSLRGRS